MTYWLNLLQNFKINKNIFLTLNPFEKINTDKIIKKVEFTHPYYDHNTLKNQKNLHLIQNKKIYYFVVVTLDMDFMKMVLNLH